MPTEEPSGARGRDPRVRDLRVRDADEAAILELLRGALGEAARAPAGTLGIGDDCALLAPPPAGESLLLTVDALVAGTHFDWRWASPRLVGRKAMAVNVSDIASMAGRPVAALLALTLPGGLPLDWLRLFAEGFSQEATVHGVRVVGGNLARGPELTATVTLVGAAATSRARLRSGARPGDVLLATGALGASARGLAILRAACGEAPITCEALAAADPRWPRIDALHAADACVRAHLTPTPRLRAADLLAADAHALIDLSDGLARDAGHVAAASGCALVLDAASLPLADGASARDALFGGEDYELLAAVSKERVSALVDDAGEAGERLAPVGEVTAGEGAWLRDGEGRLSPLRSGGFEHFLGS